MNTPGSIFVFATHKRQKLRTVGTLFLLPNGWSKLDDWTAVEIQALARMLDPNHDNLAAAARGKLVLASFTEEEINTCCYQIQGKNADQVFCGNSTAAASALAFKLRAQTSPEFTFHCNGRELRIQAEVDFEYFDRYRVSQVWRTQTSEQMFQQLGTIGPKAARCTIFNDYLVVDGSAGSEVPGLMGYLSSLAAKIAIVRKVDSFASVEFFNCNGPHGASPQTGLATLAVLRARLPWLRSLLNEEEVNTPAGRERLPSVTELDNSTIEITVPEVSVELAQIDVLKLS
jgi:hypothetical protein